jgi:hypothetical protein
MSVVFAIMLLSWGRSALYAWNIAPPEGLDAETPVFPFTSTKARVLTALVLSLIFGLFIVLFSLSLELGQLLSLSVASLSIFVFFVILYCHSIRTYRMCKDLVVSQPWFLHSLTVVVAMLSFEVIWLCQSLLVYKLPVDTMFQSFIPLGSFSDEASQVPHPPFCLFKMYCHLLKKLSRRTTCVTRVFSVYGSHLVLE